MTSFGYRELERWQREKHLMTFAGFEARRGALSQGVWAASAARQSKDVDSLLEPPESHATQPAL